MLILPPGHGRSLTMPRPALRAREKWLLGGVLGMLAAGAVVLVISLAVAGRATGHGCVDVKFAGATGAIELYRCGAGAKDLCASVSSTGDAGMRHAIAVQCRKARIPTG